MRAAAEAVIEAAAVGEETGCSSSSPAVVTMSATTTVTLSGAPAASVSAMRRSAHSPTSSKFLTVCSTISCGT
ncbi:hypothetical protein [Sinomonas sp. P47F7]|uniref:hypothetical protein n=1 Tax=Sinomonas sp. P47F7 TaxID=3410987 RepID=UPI003BF5290D